MKTLLALALLLGACAPTLAQMEVCAAICQEKGATDAYVNKVTCICVVDGKRVKVK